MCSLIRRLLYLRRLAEAHAWRDTERARRDAGVRRA